MAAWQAAGRSVCGSQHRRRRMPAQDAIAFEAVDGVPGGVALAVADGHGGPASFRSDRGAHLAVTTAIEVLSEYARAAAESTTLAPPEAERLARRLVDRWRARVRDHLAAHPFSREQAAALEAGARHAAADDAAVLPYGSTLLAALALPDRLLCCQLGDGDILLVSGAGEVRRAWPRDGRLLGGETTSLCLPEAWREMRLALRSLERDAPALVLLSSDGYANSFRKENGFLRVGRDILEFIQRHGMQRLERDLEAWLAESSELGSGDDITVGLLYRAARAGVQPSHRGRLESPRAERAPAADSRGPAGGSAVGASRGARGSADVG